MDRQKLKTIILNKNLLLGEVAEEIGVTDNTLSRFFSGTSNLNCDAFVRLLEVADIDVDEILNDRLAVLAATGKKKESILARVAANQVERFQSWRS